MARLGGVLQVVLALWSNLGSRMELRGADFGPQGTRKGGAGILPAMEESVSRKWVGLNKLVNNQPDY